MGVPARVDGRERMVDGLDCRVGGEVESPGDEGRDKRSSCSEGDWARACSEYARRSRSRSYSVTSCSPDTGVFGGGGMVGEQCLFRSSASDRLAV